MKHNMSIVNGLKALADKKGATTAQLCIAWVASLGPHLVPIPGSSYVQSIRSRQVSRSYI